jgi:radical SAM PhpK family P-methyltransferase
MIDCLIIGFNDSNFKDYVDMVKAMGRNSGAYKDLNLSFIEYNNRPYRAMDILNHFYFQNRRGTYKPFHNADFLWPVIIYLGTYLSKKGFSFDYINLFNLEKDRLRKKLIKNDILSIAITTTLYVSPHPILEIISFIRKYNDKVKIIIGGPYILTQAEMADTTKIQQLFGYIKADFYVISPEGEHALVNILKALKNASNPDRIENIAYLKGDKYLLTSSSTEANSLEENMADYSLFPKDDINKFVSLRTAKSCPFSCAFCGFSKRAGKYRYLTVDFVEKELNAIRNIGSVTTLTFLDDTFNVPSDRFKAILKMMIKNQYEFKWNSFYRCDHGDEETISLMKEAGCEGVFLGIESGSNAMLKKMNKTARRKDYEKAIPTFKEAEIITHANLVVGFPGETHETVAETIALLDETRPDFFRAQLWYCDPITPVWNKRKELGINGSAFNWSHNTMNFQTASDLIDEMFLSVNNPLWLPQNGFELWSIFYLQRKGMALDRIKMFIESFNAAIKEKLLYPDKKGIDSNICKKLRQSCQFDSQVNPGRKESEVFSNDGGIASPSMVIFDRNMITARDYWIAKLSREIETSNLKLDYPRPENYLKKTESVFFECNRPAAPEIDRINRRKRISSLCRSDGDLENLSL